MNKQYEQAWIQDTHHFNPDWRHLDDGHFANWQWRALTETEFFDADTVYRVFKISVKGNPTIKELHQALADYFVSGCSCSHDCCGHYFGGLNKITKPRSCKKNQYMVFTSYQPNY